MRRLVRTELGAFLLGLTHIIDHQHNVRFVTIIDLAAVLIILFVGKSLVHALHHELRLIAGKQDSVVDAVLHVGGADAIKVAIIFTIAIVYKLGLICSARREEIRSLRAEIVNYFDAAVRHYRLVHAVGLLEDSVL